MTNAPGTNGAINNMNERSIEPRHEWHDLANSRLHAMHWDPSVATQPPCLLVHGLGSNARLWDGVAWRLAELGHPTVAIDQRGHGQSSKPDSGYDMATVTDELFELINHLGWDQPLVAGQSWGANVVLELGYRHPTASQAIACVDGGFIELQERFPVWEDAAEMMAPPKLAGTPYTKMQQWMAKSNADWPEEGRRGQLASFEVLDDGTVTPWLTFERHLQVLRGLWEHRPSTRYANINTPLMMIPADTGDVAWTASKRAAVDAAIEALPHGRADWFSPAHHDVHAQHPAEVADLLHQAATKADFFL
jgi:pimeloyl-ACP methyl ester carboxylesterase